MHSDLQEPIIAETDKVRASPQPLAVSSGGRHLVVPDGRVIVFVVVG